MHQETAAAFMDLMQAWPGEVSQGRIRDINYTAGVALLADEEERDDASTCAVW
jgi:hypothetical protein